ncbi:MAG: LysR family transcriptional regulator, partial [Planctomycetota bacterium]
MFYSASRDMIDRFEQLRNELNSLKSSSRSRINVAAIFSIGMHTLPNYVKEFMVSYPNVNVHIEYFGAVRIYELVLA